LNLDFRIVDPIREESTT